MQTADGEGTHTRTEIRAPGSELILPANPLHSLTDESLEGFVDCTLYEETAVAGKEDGGTGDVDELAPPPRPRTITGDVLAPLFGAPAMPRTRTATSPPVPITGAYALTPQGLRPLAIPPPLPGSPTGAYTAAIDPASGAIVAVPADGSPPTTGVYVLDPATGALVPRATTGAFMLDANGVARPVTGVYTLDPNGVPVPRTNTGSYMLDANRPATGVYTLDPNGVPVPRTNTGAYTLEAMPRTSTGAYTLDANGVPVPRANSGALMLDARDPNGRTNTADMNGVRTQAGTLEPSLLRTPDGSSALPPADGEPGASALEPSVAEQARARNMSAMRRRSARTTANDPRSADGVTEVDLEDEALVHDAVPTDGAASSAIPMLPSNAYRAVPPTIPPPLTGAYAAAIDPTSGAIVAVPAPPGTIPPYTAAIDPTSGAIVAVPSQPYTAAIDPTTGAVVAVPSQSYTTAIDPTSGAVVTVPVAQTGGSGVYQRPRPVSGLYAMPVAPAPEAQRAITEDVAALTPARSRWP